MDPAAANERMRSLDIVRGFALLGVFLVNWQSPISWSGLEETVNAAAAAVLEALVVGKFYRLFALLFGVGFVLHMRRCESRGAPFVRIYLRRLAVLFVIGLAHGVLLWPNDILALFAQLGVLLLVVRRTSNRGLLLVATLCLLAAPARYYVHTDFADFLGPGESLEVDPAGSATDVTIRADAEELDPERIRREGSYPDFVAYSSRQFFRWQTDVVTRLQALREEFLMFLVGLWAGRSGLLGPRSERISWARRVFVVALLVGAGAHIIGGWLNLYADHPVHGHLAVTFRQIARAVRPAAVALAYGVGVLLAVEHFGLQKLLAPIGSVGRMALTCYLSLSALVVLTFYAFGLGLYGRVTVLGGIALATVSYAAVAAASSWWLARYRFGPAEWLWRSITYGSWQPMK